MKNIIFPTVLFCSIVGCSKEEAVQVDDYKVSDEGAQVIAQINRISSDGVVLQKGQITKAELDYNLAFYSSNPLSNTEDGRITVLNEMIEDQVMYNKAIESGFDKHPEFLINQRKLLAYEYRKYLQKKIGESTKVTDVDLDLFYKQNKDRYTKPAMFRVAIYERRSDLKRKYQHSLDQISQAVSYLKPEEGFGKYAQSSSHLKSANRGGKLSWMSEKSKMAGVSSEVLEAASKLNVGEISNVIKADNKAYLVRLIGKKAKTVSPLAEVQADLRNQLLEARQQEKLAILTKQAKETMDIRIDDDKVKQASPKPHSFGPPGFPAN